jgi:hypothetical protein
MLGAMRWLWALSLSGCSLVVDFDDPQTRDGSYVVEGPLQSDNCGTYSAPTIRLQNIELHGDAVTGGFDCDGSTSITAQHLSRTWSCAGFEAQLEADFSNESLVGTYTLTFGLCSKTYAVTGMRQ